MPVYNGLPYLKQSVESVTAQTHEDWQCVIVNDGSTDGSREYLEQLSDPRFVIVHQENTGIAGAVNAGLARCTGKYIARLDADDVAMPTRLAEQAAYLEDHHDVGLLGTQVVPLGDRSTGPNLRLPLEHDAIMRDLRTGRHAVAHSSIMMRADVLRSVGGYWSHAFGEEYDLMLRVGEQARLANLDRVLMHYRVHQSSMNGSAMRRMRTSIDYACELARRRQAGEPAIAYDAYVASRAARAWWRRAAEAVDIHARSQYRLAIAEMYGRRPVRGMCRMAWAAACQPRLSFERVVRMLRRRRSSGVGQ
jgi:glycosyltransferase involved in cell wall biosynthesis